MHASEWIQWTEPLVHRALICPNDIVLISYTKHVAGRNIDVDNERVSCNSLVFQFLQAMHKLNSPIERQSRGVSEHDGKGFNKFDAEFLMDVADSSRSYNSLSYKQAIAVAKRLLKYKKQIIASQPKPKIFESSQNNASPVTYNKVEQLSMFENTYSKG